jgi:inorganic pyrophosphatase
VRYLGYPGNYGMVPRTLLPREQGGDGDPLDVVVLGDAVARGTILEVRVVGLLKLLDGGEWDDKLLAVQAGTALGEVEDLEQLNARFPGVTRIVEIWFENYKGPGEMESLGFGSAADARAVLATAAAAFEAKAAEPLH